MENKRLVYAIHTGKIMLSFRELISFCLGVECILQSRILLNLIFENFSSTKSPEQPQFN